MDKVKVAVLGATGMVGQRFIQLLSSHPWFEVSYLAASRKHEGKRYGDVVRWVLNEKPPEKVTDIVIGDASIPDRIPSDIDIVFSALPSSVAMNVELKLVKKGYTVISNASAYRLEPDVPLINPEVNHEHLVIAKSQRSRRGWAGTLVKNPNCTTAILTLSLAPLHEEFGIEQVIATSMQAISGAGIYGVPAYLILDNIIPYIEGEETKVAKETVKIFSKVSSRDELIPPDLSVSAITTRVPVLDAHMISVHVKLKKEASVEDVVEAMKEYRSLPQELRLPTAPQKPIIVRHENDRPQPRLDREFGNGMSVVVGRVSEVDHAKRWIKYVVLGHNTVRGAAGNAILIAELLKASGILPNDLHR